MLYKLACRYTVFKLEGICKEILSENINAKCLYNAHIQKS